MSTNKSPEREFEALLVYLQQSRGFDFTGYKRSTLMRRVQKRMREVGIESFGDYLDYLQVHPDEFAHLFNTILINVTSFFRDKDAWEFLDREIVPRILQARGGGPDGEAIRCWCAGTASGEEAYSLAILLTRVLGVDVFRRRVKIYATDVDEEALAQARPGGYSAKDLDGLDVDLVRRYFESAGSRYVFRSDLRRSLIFGRHDLVQDAPISRLDLLICRNTLMYFTSETQRRILARLHYALNDTGFLFLGKAEMLLTHASLFRPVDIRHRVFARVPKVNLRDRVMLATQGGNPEGAQHVARQIRMLELTHDAMPAAQLVIDSEGRVALINEKARSWFRLNGRDVGRPLQDLEISYRPVDLRSLIDQAYAEHRATGLLDIRRQGPENEVRHLHLEVIPLLDNGSGIIGCSITFVDVSDARRLQDELERSRQELETAYEELQSTNEELETTNEELQSTVEELETTNEELQSSNEELETMNEELESTNSELQTINAELRQRTDEVERVNEFMESILRGLQLGVIVVDSELRVRMWHGRSHDLWGLRASEVFEQPLTDLDIGLPLAEVRDLVRRCFADGGRVHEAVVDATNRRGRRITCRILATGIPADRQDRGVMLLIEEDAGRAS